MTSIIKKKYIQIFSNGSLHFCFRSSLHKTYSMQLFDLDFKRLQKSKEKSNNLGFNKKKNVKYRKKFLVD